MLLPLQFMIKKNILIITLFLPFLLSAQIKITDLSQFKEIEVEKYDSSYFIPNYKFNSKEVMKGLIGNHITFLNISKYDLELYRLGTKIEYTNIKEEDYIFKSFKIIDVIYKEYNNRYVLKSGDDSILFKPTYSNTLIIEEGFKKFQNKYLNKKYFSISLGEIKSIDDITIFIKKDNPIFVSDIEIGKLSINQFGVLFSLKYHDTTFKMSLNLEDDFFSYGETPEGKIDFVNEHYNYLKLIDLKLYDLLQKSKFKSNIYKTQVALGMSETEILLSWGIPSKYINAAGYDNIMKYSMREGENTFLYIRGGKCVKIL